MISIEIENLHYAYKNEDVLKNLSFNIKQGEFFIIIGPNGSGKTTLLKTLNNIITPDKGLLKISGYSIKSYKRKSLSRKISFVSQDTNLDFPFTANEIVMMGRSPHLGLFGLETDIDCKIVENAMEFTHVSHLKDRLINQLSGGERQRVYIARAICQDPEIILLDEPTASLDLSHQVLIMDLMEKLRIEKNITIVMVSHDINLAALYADRLLLMKNGEIIKIGKPENVITYENLEKTYECVIMVDKNPLGNFPIVIPVPGRYLSNKGGL